MNHVAAIHPPRGGREIDMDIGLEDIHAAAERIRGRIYDSPCPVSIPLSELTGCEIYCKLDYLQRTGSFKERGALNALLSLDETARRRGVIAASAGNHALGLAHHGGLLGIPVTVVMPRFAPLMKASTCRTLGAKVILYGESFHEAYDHALELVNEKGLTYINGFNDAAIIAGQGTMGLEILEQVPEVEAVVVPIGGGGLIAGVSLALKSIRPDIEVIGVEPKRAAGFTAALKAGQPVEVEVGSTLADGLAVSRVGDRAFAVARDLVDRVVTVGERSIARAILKLVELEKSVVEGAGAVGLAALLAGILPELKGRKVVLPLCGGNIDATLLGRIIERGLVAEGRICRFEAVISDRPGGLARLTAVLAQADVSIIDIAHDRAFSGEDVSSVVVHCVVETRDSDHIEGLRDRLASEGFEIRFQDLIG